MTDGNTSFNDLKNSASLTVKEFASKPKTDIKSKSVKKNIYFSKAITNSIAPKIDIDVEKNKLRKIKNGKITIDGTLDLHGFSLIEAEDRLKIFVSECLRRRMRFLLIITGKGSNSKPNIHGKTQTIKSEIKNWLSDSFYADKVQYISKALDRHGGEGAYYFFLKKSKHIFS